MIQVTLQFNTLAAAIAALIAALAALDPDVQAGAIISGPATTGKQTPASTPATAAAAAQTAASSAPPASSPKPAESPAPAASAATSAGEANTALEYEKDVKPLVLKVGAAGKRDNLVELLKKFGVAKGPELLSDKLPAFKSELEALLA